jgi:hypothetical protein
MLPCEGVADTSDPANDGPAKTALGKRNIRDYTTAGGRLFATHYSYTWLAPLSGTNTDGIAAAFPSVANWNLTAPSPMNPYTLPFDAGVVTTFPKGAAFADWLVEVEASSTRGAISLIETRHNVDSVNTGRAQAWITGFNTRHSGGGRSIVPHLTFNTPVDPPPLPDGGTPVQCGRAVFSSFHVSANAVDATKTSFPTICKDEPPSAQEKALIFMFFDLAACVQDDNKEPEIPVCSNQGQGCSTNADCCTGMQCIDQTASSCNGAAGCTCDAIIGKPSEPGMP